MNKSIKETYYVPTKHLAIEDPALAKEIPSFLAKQVDLISDLTECVDVLYSRLDCVMSPGTDAISDDIKKNEDPSITQYGGIIFDNNVKLSSQINQLKNMEYRLEL